LENQSKEETMKRLLFAVFLFSAVQAGPLERDSVIDFILTHEGGYVVYRGVEYNYGLSGKYFGDVKHMTLEKAKEIYRNLWIMTGAYQIPDAALAAVYFDTAILFCENTAQKLLLDTRDFRTYCIKRLQEHFTQVQKCPALKECLRTWVQRTMDLYDKCNRAATGDLAFSKE
jgi:hypothetical protein